MAAENYTNTFGGENVSPANLSYVAYAITSNTRLNWAFEAVEGQLVTADKIDISGSVAGLTVAMPPANRVTVGQDALFGNPAAQPYTVTDSGGNVICTVASGLEWFIWLIDNGTENGVWRSVQFGASTSVANSAALAGAGLRANLTRLDQNIRTTPLVSSYTINDSDRATVIENTGGNVTYTFPNAGTVGNGWFVYVINAGSGNIILTPIGGQTIDNAPTKTIGPGESLAALSDGGNYHSLGYGRSVVTTVTGTSIAVGGPAGTTTLSPTQVAAQIQDFTGVLTGNRRIEYGAVIGYWFVYNHTTPATPFTMTMATVGADPGVIVPQGAFSIVRSNGANMAVAFSGAVGTVTSVATSANMIGGPITSTGTLDLSNTGVTAATYGAVGPPILMPSVAIDAKGRITTASSITLGTAASKDYSAAVGLLDAGKVALLDTGGNLPSANGGFQPGDVVYSIALTKPGFVFANGTTIGNIGSGGSQRAAADTANLFAVLWALSPTISPIFTSTGAASSRGANAAADFTALKRLTVIDLRGTVIAGLDTAGGAATANRLSSVMASTTMGASGGEQLHALSVAELASHNHPDSGHGHGVTDPTHTHSFTFYGPNYPVTSNYGGDFLGNMGGGGSNIYSLPYTGYSSTGISVNAGNANPAAAGSGSAHNTVQPTVVMNPFIKL